MKAILSALILCSAVSQARAMMMAPFRTVKIPAREHGYNNFKTTIIDNQKELDAFLAKTAKQRGWNNRKAFVDAIGKSGVNFKHEKMILLRHTEGSGSVDVKLGYSIDRGKLTLEIKRNEPQMGTCDMAYYCYCVLVSRHGIEQVIFDNGKGKRRTIMAASKDDARTRKNPDNGEKPRRTRRVFMPPPLGDGFRQVKDIELQ